LCETASYKPSRVKIGSVVFAVRDDKKKKRRKGTKRNKLVMLHVFVEKPPVNGF